MSSLDDHFPDPKWSELKWTNKVRMVRTNQWRKRTKGGFLRYFFQSFGDDVIYPTSFGAGMAEVFFFERWDLFKGLFYYLLYCILFGQIIATSHDLTPNAGLVMEIPLFQGNLGWWNIIIWPDLITIALYCFLNKAGAKQHLGSESDEELLQHRQISPKCHMFVRY